MSAQAAGACVYIGGMQRRAATTVPVHHSGIPFHTNLNLMEDWIGGDKVVVRFRVGVNEGAIRLLMNGGNGRN